MGDGVALQAHREEEETLLYCVECEEEAASLNDEGLCPDCAEPTANQMYYGDGGVILVD